MGAGASDPDNGDMTPTHGPRSLISALSGLVLALVACTPRGGDGDPAQGDPAAWGSWKSGSTSRDGGSGGGFEEPGGVGDEICDGWDNDLDGEIDEGTDGVDCAIPGGGQGQTVCLRGHLQCMECPPGAQKNENCGCGIDRIDLCSPEGRWIVGPCDSCEVPVLECQCNPGEEMFRRCDDCSGADCGATCVGATFRCGEDCQWTQLTACEAKVPQCMGDTTRIEECGRCGSRELTCDGCFWSYERCEDQGACFPGETQKAPCYGADCTEGFVAELGCTDQCVWETPITCSGCAVGDVNDRPEPCLTGYQCGSYIKRNTCVGHSLQICGGDAQLVEGEWVESTVGVCDIECVPGTTEFCVLADGRAGEREIGCDNTCHLTGSPSACGASSGSCVPGTVVEYDEDCGCGTMVHVVKTCRAGGDGWSEQANRSQCPECRPGQSEQVNCSTSGGQCGQASKSCSSACTWQAPSSCNPRPDACTPGQEQVTEASCGPNTCGRTARHVRRCRSDGCGWEEFDDRSQCPACSAGGTRDTGQLCVPGTPACGSVQQYCNASCSWETQPCRSCD